MSRFGIGRRGRLAGVSMMAVGALVLGACGGGDGGGGGGKTASDEEYVSSMCDAFNTFAEDFLGKVMAAALSGGSEAESEKKALEAAKDVFKPLLDDMKSMGVPKDVRKYHDEMVKQLEEAMDAIEDGGLEALDESFGEDINLPEDIEKRLQAVADKTDECEDLDLFTS